VANCWGDRRDQGVRSRGRGDGDLSADREDALYGLPLDQFIPERDELAKQLRGDGDRDGVARVKKLRKPTVAAWAVNQLARSQPKTIRELADAGEALRDAQAALVAGKGDADELRSAGERERAAVQELLEAARGLLSGSGAGLSESTLEDVADTLRAAAIDDETREAVLAGRLDRERRAAGLGAGLGAFAVSSGAARTKAEPKAAPARAAKGKAAPVRGKGARGKAQTTPAKPRTGKAAEAERAKAAAEREAARQAEAARQEEQRAARAAAKEAASAARRAEREHELAESRLRGAQEALDKAKETHAAAKAEEREARRRCDQAAKEAKRL
jgi:hypothetical protein